MPAKTTAPALFSQDHKAPPILTPGALTPALLRAFQIGSMQYLVQKNIATDKQVNHVVWGLRDPRVQNWYINDMVSIDALTFTAFMNEVRKNWLLDGWEGVIENSILKSNQGDRPFWDWLQSL